MKWLLLILALCVAPAFSAPFVVADVVSGVTDCGVFLDGGAKVVIPATGTECRFDVANVSNGQHSITMTAIGNQSLWGGEESAPSSPFVFVRPAPPTVPATLRLEP